MDKQEYKEILDILDKAHQKIALSSMDSEKYNEISSDLIEIKKKLGREYAD